MKESTKQRKIDEWGAKLFGVTLEEYRKMRGDEEQSDKTREAQAVLLFMEHPHAFMQKECDECGMIFMTTYKFVSLCSNACRIKSLRRMGIEWNPSRNPDERWRRAKIPVDYTIPPHALDVLLSLAKTQQQKSESHISLDDSLPGLRTVVARDSV